MAVSLAASNAELHDTEVVNKTTHNFKTKIGNKYSAKDVIKVWDCISRWIENNLNREKGILMKGIGYFTLAKWEINVGKGYPYTIRKPVFVIDEKLANDYNLKRKRVYNTGKIYERYFNLLSVAQEFQLNIDMVTHCFKEIVTAFKKLLHEEKNCELPFPKIGKLQVKNKIVTMRFYREFLEKQNQQLKTYTENEKKKYLATSYNPDWDVDQYKNKKRPCSATSVISRPASSLSTYQPGTGYEGVLPNSEDITISRPCSRASVQSRPDSRASVQSRPDSRASIQSRPNSKASVQSRPDSRASIQSMPDSGTYVHSRPCSRTSVQSRPESRMSNEHPKELVRPVSTKSNQSCDQTKEPLEMTELLANKTRPSSRTSLQSNRSCKSSDSTKRLSSSYSNKFEVKCNKLTDDISPPISICSNVRPNTKRSVSKHQQCLDKDGFTEGMLLTTENDIDKALCYLCNIRKRRLDKIDKCKEKLSVPNVKDDFMKGDNPINRLIDTKNINEQRKNLVKEIYNYNYVTANKLLDSIKNEKNKKISEKNIENNILHNRPDSICNRIEERTKFKNSLLDQIEHNKIKNETEKTAALKSEKLVRKKMLKSLHEERMKNIEAKKRAKENYLILLNEHIKNKQKFTEEMKRKDESTLPVSKITSGFDNSTSQCDAKILNKRKNLEIADYQLKQQNVRNLANREQNEKDMDFERCLLKQLKEEDEISQRKMLEKKLNQKKFAVQDLNEFLVETEAKRCKNEIPGAYPMRFPLQKMAERCRRCKGKLGYPTEKISELPY